MLGPLLRNVARVSYGFYPVAVYLPQFHEIKRTGQEGFSSVTCLVALLLAVLRIAFWILRRVRAASYAMYSVTLLLMHLLLLDALLVARHQRSRKSSLVTGSLPAGASSSSSTAAGAVGPSGQSLHHPIGGTNATTSHHSSGSSSSSSGSARFASNFKKLVRAFASGRRQTALELWRKTVASFWAWDDLAPYVEVVVVFALGVIVTSATSLKFLVSRDTYLKFLEVLVALFETAVPLPQLFRVMSRVFSFASHQRAGRFDQYSHYHPTGGGHYIAYGSGMSVATCVLWALRDAVSLALACDFEYSVDISH